MSKNRPNGKHFKNSKSCAYCVYHDWFMSIGIINARGCMHMKNTGSRCKHLEIILDNPYWRQQNKKKKFQKK